MRAPHVMLAEGIDHIYETCPSFRAERRACPDSKVSVGEVDGWEPEPPETLPFGLCTWCYRLYCRRIGRPVPERLWHAGWSGWPPKDSAAGALQ